MSSISFTVILAICFSLIGPPYVNPVEPFDENYQKFVPWSRLVERVTLALGYIPIVNL